MARRNNIRTSFCGFDDARTERIVAAEGVIMPVRSDTPQAAPVHTLSARRHGRSYRASSGADNMDQITTGMVEFATRLL